MQEAEAEPRGNEGGEQAGEPYAGGVSYDQGGRRKLSYLFRETSDKASRARLSSAVVSGIWRRSQCLAMTGTGEKGGPGTGATDLEKGAAADEKRAKGGKASRVQAGTEDLLERFEEGFTIMPALELVGSRLWAACQGAAPGHQRGDVLEQQRQQPGCDGGCIAQQVGSHKRAQDRGDGYVRVPSFPGGPKRGVCGGPRHGRRRGRRGHDHGGWGWWKGSLIRGRVLQRERSSRLREVGSCAGGRR